MLMYNTFSAPNTISPAIEVIQNPYTYFLDSNNPKTAS